MDRVNILHLNVHPGVLILYNEFTRGCSYYIISPPGSETLGECKYYLTPALLQVACAFCLARGEWGAGFAFKKFEKDVWFHMNIAINCVMQLIAVCWGGILTESYNENDIASNSCIKLLVPFSWVECKLISIQLFPYTYKACNTIHANPIHSHRDQLSWLQSRRQCTSRPQGGKI